MAKQSNIVAFKRANEAHRPSLALQVEIASRTVPPLWPLDGAIAVNPLAGFEEKPFEHAVRAGADQFNAKRTLSLPLWRSLCETGRLDREQVREVAIARLGGFGNAFHRVAPDITLIDCLMALLFDCNTPEPSGQTGDAAAEQVASWCAAYFDAGTSALAMPGRDAGLFAVGRSLMPYIRGLDCQRVTGAPVQPLPMIRWALDRLGTGPDDIADVLAASVARLPGWAGHIRWRTDHADPDLMAEAPATMAELIALLLLTDVATGKPPMTLPPPKPYDGGEFLTVHFGFDDGLSGRSLQPVLAMDGADLGMIFQEAAELGFANPLARAMERKVAAGLPSHDRPDAQLVFCIDVRSEPMRRAIEAQGKFETAGYAGFFGLPIAVQEPERRRVRQLPVLIAPQHDLALAPVAGAEAGAETYLVSRRRSQAGQRLFTRLKSGTATTFATAEAFGPVAAALMLIRTLSPQAMRRIERSWKGDARALSPTLDRHGSCAGLTAEERLAYAKAIFALTGIKPKARLVVLVGHTGEAVNNPYKSALDCGACAGHGGAPNARALAAILNEPATRIALSLPDDCWFLAGEHNTTTDIVELFDCQLAPNGHAEDIIALRQSLTEAGKTVRAIRAPALDRSVRDLAVGAAHWGEVRPEWGLTGNAAFIVAPRSLTRELDLEGRAFLHEYHWQADPDGEALATILTAPMVVAQWINCQYLFSTIDNDRYGAGDKILHNPVGRIGVVRGNGGDLAVGLPRQSLFHDNGHPAHIPQRLTTFIHAPLDKVAAVIESQAVLRRLFGNGWVRLIVIDPATGRARRWLDDTELHEPDNPTWAAYGKET